MSTETEVKLLTLLNVSAIKKPRDLDVPGGHRGSPSQSGSRDVSPPVQQPKKRKSVNFGGELGPSGSTYGKKKSKMDANGKGKGKGKEVNGDANGNGNGVEFQDDEAHEVDGDEQIDLDDGSDDEAEPSTGRLYCRPDSLSSVPDDVADNFNVHFGSKPDILTDGFIASADGNEWTTEKINLKGFGRAVQLRPSGSAPAQADIKARVSRENCRTPMIAD